MKRAKTVDDYIDSAPEWAASKLIALRKVILDCGLNETIKWGGPVYVGKSNVVGIGAFKHFVSVWFFQGSFLEDPEKVLIAAQDETKGLRQWRFKPEDPIDKTLLKSYILEAMENDRKGLKIKAVSKPVVVPEILKEALSSDPILNERFGTLSTSHRREYCEYISEAKQEATKIRRLEKSINMIMQGAGLNDKYKS